MSNNIFNLTGWKVIIHCLVGVVGYLLIQSFGAFIFSVVPNKTITYPITAAISIGLLFLVLYLYSNKVLRVPLAEFRVRKPQTFVVWIVCAFALPIMVSAFFIIFVPGTYTNHNLDIGQTLPILSEALFAICFTAGICEEFLFRGYIMRLLEARWNRIVAVLAPSMVFGVLHIIGMPEPNLLNISILFVAGTSVGVMFSMIAYQTNSIWPSAIVHGVWNLVIIGKIMDISAVHQGESLFTYTLQTKSIVLTGGSFGIESSIPAIIGYWVVILIAVFLQKKHAKSNI